MEMAQIKSNTRHVALAVALAVLIVSAGCSSFLTDGNPPAERTEPAPGTQTPAPTNNTSQGGSLAANGSDLRSVSIPDNASSTVYGEIDGGDSVLEGTNRYYEPIVFAAESGDTANVTMSSIANDPELRLRNPNGTTVAIDNDGGSGNDAQFEMLTLNETGQYTLVASAVEPNTGFDYTLTVEGYENNSYGATEVNRYNEFTYDYLLTAQFQSGGRTYYINESQEPQGNLTGFTTRSANASTDSAVVGYYVDEDMSTREAIEVDVALMQSYASMYEEYRSNDTDIENEPWVPDRIYQIGYNREGELYRVTYMERDWAEHLAESGIENTTALQDTLFTFIGTVQHGPAHPEYQEGSDAAVADPQNPLATYEGFENGTFEDGWTE